MRKGLAAAGVVALIATGSAACGADTPTTPQGKVTNAFEKLSNQKSLTMELAFDGSAEEIYSALKNEDDFTQDTAKVLSDLRLSLAVSSEKSFNVLKGTEKGSSGYFRLATDEARDKGLFEVRVVDQKVYLRVDIKGLENLSPSAANSSGVKEFNEFLDGADDLPSSLAAAKAALKGEWISIDPKAFAEFAKSMSKDMGDGEDSPLAGLPDTKALDAKSQKKAVAALRAAFAHNATFADLGKRDGADHVKVTVPARQFAKEFVNGLGSLTDQIHDFKLSDVDKVPNKSFSVDVAIKKGIVTGLTFDIAQLDTDATGKLPLTLSLDNNVAPITAPQGAKLLNPQDLLGLAMSGFSSSEDSDSGSGSDSDSIFG